MRPLNGGDELVLRATYGDAEARIEGSVGEVDAVAGALDRCTGAVAWSSIVAGLPGEHLVAVQRCIQHLTGAGLVVDGRSSVQELLQELHRSIPRSGEELGTIQAQRRWRDPRADVSTELARSDTSPGAGTLARDRSLGLAIDRRSAKPVPEAAITSLAGRSYGSMGAWKPVASAGRLQPIVLHAITCSAEDPELLWFDDEALQMHRLPHDLDLGALIGCFLQSPFIDQAFQAAGRW